MKGRIFALVVILLLAVVACSTPEPEVLEVTRVIEKEKEVVVTQEVVVTEVVEVEVEGETQVVEVTTVVEKIVEATPEPVDRNGAWVDTVVVVEEPNADAAITRLTTGDIDIFADTVSNPSTYQSILEAQGLNTAQSFGSYKDMTFNPSSCADEAKINPFVSARVREAMNYLVDRDFIAQEITGGLGVARFVPINTASGDRGALAAEIRAIEAQYAHNPELAQEIVTEEMEAMGATLEGDVWTFNGEPVTVIGLIRVEDERTQIGDYFANLLEDIGFTVDRQYKTSAEAGAIWLSGEPTECQFNFYTGGWISTQISRDAGGNFEFFYTPSGLARPLWQAYEVSDEFADIANRLANNNFNTIAERRELFSQALVMAMQSSVRIWLIDNTSATPYVDDIEVAADLSGAIGGSSLWPYTLRRSGEVGGSVTIALPSILTGPWNPLGGSNWVFDAMLYRATGQLSAYPDPYTGLALPHRLETATVTVQEDLPVGKTLDWVTLETAAEITVPDDAWVDWDAENQVWLTAADVYTEAQTAAYKSVVTYPADMFETNLYHDGSNLSAADFVMNMIVTFDRAKEASPYYDEGEVPGFQSFMSGFKGMRVTSTDPLTIEHYGDNWGLDAENTVADWWPSYGFGPAGWHNLAIGLRADAAGEAAFTAAKATANEIEQLNYISGPTVEILTNQITSAAEEGFIPYAPTMGDFVSDDEAAQRYQNLQEFFRRRGHYWVGTGPFFLQRAFPVEGNAILERWQQFPDSANKWARFSEPALSTLELDGPSRVTQGDEATFDVFVDLGDQPYPSSDINAVQYLLFDATGNLVEQGEASAVEDGLYEVVLSSDTTSALEQGSNRLEVVVTSKLVALPSLGSYEFVTSP